MIRIRKLIFAFIVVVISVFMVNNKNVIKAFPSSISPSISSDYGCTLGSSFGSICAKEYSSGSLSGKAICTAFTKDAPISGSSCTPIAWSNNSETNDRVAVTIGAVINSARDSSDSISWDNYYYAQVAINRLLFYGYAEGRGYGSSYNSISRVNTNASTFNTTKYNKYLSAANTAYKNYGKTKVTLSSGKYENGVASVKVICTDASGKTIGCNLSKKEIKYRIGEGAWQTVNADITSSDTISKNIGTGATEIKFNVTDKKSWAAAQNYSCGSNYQSLTPNYLGSKTKEISNSLTLNISEINRTLKVKKVDQNGTALLGALVTITRRDLDTNQTETIEEDAALTKMTFDGEEVAGISLEHIKTGEYCITEVKAPSGYTSAEGEHCVTITDSNPDDTITITNVKKDPKRLTINKVDENGNPVVGAEIRVRYIKTDMIDEDVNTEDISDYVEEIAYFITDENPKVIDNLEVGKTYSIIEEKMPTDGGYSGGKNAVEFTIRDNNDENVVTLTNTHTSIKVSKQSITSTKELPGAKLTISNSVGEVVKEWTSTDKPQEIIGLSDGDYTLTETTAPAGYTVAESIKFTIENGVVKGDEDNTIVMKDATIVEVPDTFSIHNIITIFSGLVLVGLGTGVLFYETKKKKKA